MLDFCNNFVGEGFTNEELKNLSMEAEVFKNSEDFEFKLINLSVSSVRSTWR